MTIRLGTTVPVTIVDAGKIINTLSGRNQIQGSVVMGVGMALLERTEYNPQIGAPINGSIADRRVAVNADAPVDRRAFPRLPGHPIE